MIDRLNQLKNPTQTTFQILPSENTFINEKVEINHLPHGIEDQFTEKTTIINQYINKIKDNNQKIHSLKHLYLKATKTTQEKQITLQLQQSTNQTKIAHNQLKKLLNTLKQLVQTDETDQILKIEPETRIKRNIYNAALHNFMSVLEEQKTAQNEYKQVVKDKISRQVKLIDNNLTDHQVEDYTNQPQKVQNLLQQKIYKQPSTTLLNAVSDIQDKHKDIQKLEASVAECLQLFKQLAAMVQAQGELINNIQINCNDAKNYTEKAVVQLVEGKRHHKKLRKCKCILIIIGIIVLLAVLIPVIVTFTKK